MYICVYICDDGNICIINIDSFQTNEKQDKREKCSQTRSKQDIDISKAQVDMGFVDENILAAKIEFTIKGGERN